MIDLPPRIALTDLPDLLSGRRAVITGRVAAAQDVPSLAALPVVETPAETPSDAELVVGLGGGTRLDAAKAWRGRNRPDCALLAIPTRFGSGAEANDIAVLDDRGAKTILKGPEFRPEYRAYLPGFLQTLPEDALLWSKGDALTHALEGLLSPLATDALRADLADVLHTMLDLSDSYDAEWFELSALASAGQAQASVGLVHGLAHVLEAPARAELATMGREDQLGHARLCSGFLAPVLRYNFTRSDKAADRLKAVGIDRDAVLALANSISTPALDLPLDWPDLIEAHWKSILRDVCTRTNVATVRHGTLPALITEVSAQ
ncbi:iron-containing alcohol dehydrogenase [Ruegeria sp. HKCCD7255]|uniref:iron-containing alcohol dehydrogenase n=1 Tax=Ruegeria sp. HKCCD7255 TaxID=2683004 RepID=UPI0014889EA8|nr:iron-containing alcohol dehydrogenase [Ruegeria sp. HKCCD7255]